MVAFDENTLRNTNVMPNITLEELRDIGTADELASPPDDCFHLKIYAPKRPGIARRVIGAILKPLFVVLTTQSVITAVIVCFVAVVTAQHASKIIVEKFSAINSALKRLTP